MDKIKHSKEVIKKALEMYPNTKVAVSWGKDSMVVLHLARQVKPDIECFTVLTPFKPMETFEYADKLTNEWNLNIERYGEKEVKKGTENLHKTDPTKCCEIYKVEATKEAIKNLDGWITGLRHDEGTELRRDASEIQEPSSSGIAKINPILEWTEADIWRYIATREIPVHPWYKKGYRSLGCACCTSIISDNELERQGRWRGTAKQGGECGIHTMAKYYAVKVDEIISHTRVNVKNTHP